MVTWSYYPQFHCILHDARQHEVFFTIIAWVNWFELHGHGTLTIADGHVNVGAFGYENEHGHVYVDAFENGKRHDQGTMTFTNGDVYVGAFENNNKRGQGTWTYAYGDVFVGAYKNGWFYSPKINPIFS